MEHDHNIKDATASYEGWMRSCATVIQPDLRLKREQIEKSLFGFLKGTFYRWAQFWVSACADLRHAPKVLAVGDLHGNSFGAWRDVEGRLCWGVDDFDERVQKLGKLGVDGFKPPSGFGEKRNRLPAVRQLLARDLKSALEKTLPEADIDYKVACWWLNGEVKKKPAMV